MIAGILIAAGVSFLVASLLLGFGRLKEDQEVDDASAEAMGADTTDHSIKSDSPAVARNAEPGTA